MAAGETKERRSGGDGRKEGRQEGRGEGGGGGRQRGRDGPSRTGKGEGCPVTMDRGVRLFMGVPMRTICRKRLVVPSVYTLRAARLAYR